MKTLTQSLRVLLVLTGLTGGIYPLAVWAVGQACFRRTAEGAFQVRDGHLVGSSLLAQKSSDPRYFSPRPSAGDYATVASGASNLAWSNAALRANVVAAARRFRTENGLSEEVPLPAEVITTSGSGLDPDLSPAAIALQLPRVARVRGVAPAELAQLVAALTVTSGFGPPRVNVLELNLQLDRLAP